jgi:hypothetical protein
LLLVLFIITTACQPYAAAAIIYDWHYFTIFLLSHMLPRDIFLCWEMHLLYITPYAALCFMFFQPWHWWGRYIFFIIMPMSVWPADIYHYVLYAFKRHDCYIKYIIKRASHAVEWHITLSLCHCRAMPALRLVTYAVYIMRHINEPI